jgi:hypothetical protein
MMRGTCGKWFRGSGPCGTHQQVFFSLDLRTRFDYIGRLFSDSDDYCGGVPADLVREHGRVNDAEALDAEYTEMRIDDTRLGRSANTCGGRLQEFADELVREHKRRRG